MSRRAVHTQAEIKRAVCAIVAAGVKVYGVRVDASGFTVLTDPVPFPTPQSEAITDGAKIEAMLRGEDGPN
jgi:hypothetical protein